MNTEKPLYLRITSTERLLIIISVMSATLMQVLDTTIVNVALPHIQGTLDATPDEITWILTSYLVASGVFMPLTGYLTDRLGRKNFLLFCIAGFTIASALCGASQSLAEIVIFRLLQGIFGAGLVPLSQALLADAYPEEERGKAMAIWGIGVMVGPILGPTLGGYLTDISSWRWTFYINIPVGILALFMAWHSVPDTHKIKRFMDWPGLLLLSLGISALQYLLDRGNDANWFNAREIRVAAFLAALGFIGFLIYSLRPHKRNVFDLRIFKDRNFTCASVLLMIFGLGLYGNMVILPLMLENLFNYPVLTTGLAMAPRGISSMVAMMLIGKFSKNIDPRYFIGVGILFCIMGTWMCTWYSPNIDIAWVMGPLTLQGFGLGMIFVPLSAVAFSTLPAHTRTEAAGLFSLMRTIGSSIGISITITIFTRHTQMAWQHLTGFIQPYNTAVNQYLAPLHLYMRDPLGIAVIANEVGKQAQMLAFISTFAFITWGFCLMVPLLLMLRYQKNNHHDRAQVTIEH